MKKIFILFFICVKLYSTPVDDKTFIHVLEIAESEDVPASIAAGQLLEESGDKKSGSRGDFSVKSKKPEDDEGYYSESGFQIYMNPKKNLNWLLDMFWYGFNETEEFDVYNYVHNTKLAMRYMSYLHKTYGSWFLAACYYNCGPPGIDYKSKKPKTKKIPERSKIYAMNIISYPEPEL